MLFKFNGNYMKHLLINNELKTQTGESTTSSVLSFGFLFLVAHPEVQKMVQDEIDRILGEESPTLGERKRMPYMQVIFTKLIYKAKTKNCRPQYWKYCAMLTSLLLTTAAPQRMSG